MADVAGRAAGGRGVAGRGTPVGPEVVALLPPSVAGRGRGLGAGRLSAVPGDGAFDAAGLVRGATAGLAARAAVAAPVGRATALCFGAVATAASPEKSRPGAGSSPGSGNISAGSLAPGLVTARLENFGVFSEPGIVGRLLGRRIKKNIPPAIPMERHVINAPSRNPLPADSSCCVTAAAEFATGLSFAVSSVISSSALVPPATETRSRGTGASPLSACKS